jgi:hypothetical protein
VNVPCTSVVCSPSAVNDSQVLHLSGSEVRSGLTEQSALVSDQDSISHKHFVSDARLCFISGADGLGPCLLGGLSLNLF